jgi:choline dehydrogenase-like flavoprotein
MDAEVAAVRPALATGNVHLLTETECLRILTSKDGSRVTGVLLRSSASENLVQANAVAVCAGVSGTASLLRRSRTEKHPQGLGNANGCLGRYLAGHSVGIVFVFVSWKELPPMHTKTFAINGYYDGAPGWPYPTGTIQIVGQFPFWEKSSRLVRPIIRFIGAHALMFFYMTEALPSPDTGLVFGGDELVGRRPPVQNTRTFSKLRRLTVDTFRRAGYRVLAPRRRTVWHEVGTARFGTDPKSSVVDPNCQVHGIRGLFVVDASVLPSAGAVNTALTINALALRAGHHIAQTI